MPFAASDIDNEESDEEVDEDGESKGKEDGVSPEERKKKSDELWARLKEDNENNKTRDDKDNKDDKDCRNTSTSSFEKSVKVDSNSKDSFATLKTATSSVGKRNLSQLVSNLKKKPKVGTLFQSKIDWEDFKKEEGIEDEMKQATTRKDGFIERQAFLSRADLRQFEIEKSIRAKERKPPK